MNDNNAYQAMSQIGWPERRTQIPQVRIELNSKCGKACFYCRPSGEGVPISKLKKATQRPMHEMSIDELIWVAELLARHGICDYKLTGGEPMLCADIVEVVRRLRRVPGVRSLHLVTRHDRAGDLAQDLRDAGLDLLNFSLDSLDAGIWSRITRVDGHERLIQAVRTAARTDIPIKLSTVVLKGVNEHEIPSLVEFAGEVHAELKLLDLINDIGAFPGFGRDFIDTNYVDLLPVADQLAKSAVTREVVTQPGGLGHPMLRFQMPNGATVTIKSGRLGAYYGHICAVCPLFPCWDALMALRVTPTGLLQYCLLRDDNLVDLLGLREQPSDGRADEVVEEVIRVYRAAIPFTADALVRMRLNVEEQSTARWQLQSTAGAPFRGHASQGTSAATD